MKLEVWLGRRSCREAAKYEEEFRQEIHKEICPTAITWGQAAPVSKGWRGVWQGRRGRGARAEGFVHWAQQPAISKHHKCPQLVPHDPHVPSMFHIKSPNSQYGGFVLACSGNSGHRTSPGMCFPRARLPKCSFTHVQTAISTRFACATCCNPIRKAWPLLEVWRSGFVASLQVLKVICGCRLQNHRQVFFLKHTFGICWILLGYCSMSKSFLEGSSSSVACFSAHGCKASFGIISYSTPVTCYNWLTLHGQRIYNLRKHVWSFIPLTVLHMCLKILIHLILTKAYGTIIQHPWSIFHSSPGSVMYSKYPCDQGSCDAGSRYISASAKFVGKQWRPVCLARDFSWCICPICMCCCWILAIVPWCAIGRSLRRTNPTNRCTGNETCQDFALSDAKSRKLHWIRAKERIKREISWKFALLEATIIFTSTALMVSTGPLYLPAGAHQISDCLLASSKTHHNLHIH